MATSPEHQHKPAFSRRQVVLAVAGLMVAGCAPRRGGTAPVVAAPVAPAAAQGLWYMVEAGDTLSSISRRSGVTVDSITRANNLRSALITPGQQLFLPGTHHLGNDPMAGLLDRPSTADDPLPVAPDGGYKVIRRQQWANAAIGANHRQMGAINRITIHHTGEYAGTARLSDREILRRIDRFHREGRRWAAIGYHYLIASDGRIYEGRPESIQGAHTANNNSNNLGISMMGDYHRAPPDSRHLAVLDKFLTDTRLRLKVPKGRLFGHRDLSPSICPGDALYAWLQRYKRS
ncbi:MAG: LysM peptidoglycan-binding domain-containing protein [Planctomycetota bacterium]|nr:MAG: LysM peptidoglycan-binding domain-containing protein [Planctomycetota bacterium]